MNPNQQVIAQRFINELMEDFARFPERMIPLGPIENLQIKLIAILEAQEMLRAQLVDANRGAERNAHINTSLAHQLNAAQDTLQTLEPLRERLIAADQKNEEAANAQYALVRQLNAAEAKLAKIREVLDGYPAAQGLKNN